MVFTPGKGWHRWQLPWAERSQPFGLKQRHYRPPPPRISTEQEALNPFGKRHPLRYSLAEILVGVRGRSFPVLRSSRSPAGPVYARCPAGTASAQARRSSRRLQVSSACRVLHASGHSLWWPNRFRMLFPGRSRPGANSREGKPVNLL